MPKPPGRGRPPKPPADVRGVVMHIRMTEAERDAIEELAASAGLSVGRYMTAQAIGKVGRPKKGTK